MGKLTFSDGTTIDEVYVNGDGFETNTNVDPSIFTTENLKKIDFQDGSETQSYSNAKLLFYFTIIEESELEYRFGFYEETVQDISDSKKISIISEMVLSDEQAAQAPFLFDEWDPNSVTYTAEVSKVQYNGLLYKCLQSHTSQASWTPTDAPSLWVRIDNPAEEWPEWRQPSGSTDAYSKGDKVSHNGKHWISNVDGTNTNTWEPGVFGWDEQPSDE